MRDPEYSIGTGTYFYAIRLVRNQVADGTANCICSIDQPAKEKDQRHA